MILLRGVDPKDTQASLVGQVWEHLGETNKTLYLVVSDEGLDSRLLSLDNGKLFWMRTNFMQDSVLWRRVV